ncbi:nuclear transport factor 2 family protein [Prauserella flavalba]|uniref:SnoaL-like domain-containing protein n=1 Tax=Prauserella flavalba TaxID=1477506 RepID=A0A318LNG9_9PSEU|nr:nuclear transport factor 2 family protein [Prauserella flavalba]PXY28646.1 hypothetical protein BA062_22570 [Prauserella flavalba]
MSDVLVDRVQLARKALSHLDTKITERSLEDYRPFFDLLAEGVVFEYASPGASGSTCSKQELVDYVTDLFESLSDPMLAEEIRLTRSLEYFAQGDRVVVLWSERSVDKKSGDSGPDKEAVAIFDFMGNEIVRLRKFSQ